MDSSELAKLRERALAGGPEKYREAQLARGKHPVRERIRLLVDEGSFVEDGLLANNRNSLAADGVVTGTADVDGRPVCVMANDPTVKAGSWGARTVEKMVRATETALREELPIVWLVDSAGARITDQVELFPGRRGAGRIFHNQVAISGRVNTAAATVFSLMGATPSPRACHIAIRPCMAATEASISTPVQSPAA